MKYFICVFLLMQSVSVALAQSNQTVTLVGIVDGFGMRRAVFKIPIPWKNPSFEEVILNPGQAQDGVELLSIDSAREIVSVKVSGQPRSLELKEADGTSHTNNLGSGPLIHLVSIDLKPAISLYAGLKKRTILPHPRLAELTFSMRVNPETESEASAAFEKMFNEGNIATIPDGDKFVMMVPFAYTNTVKPSASSLIATNAMLPSLSVNFHSVPVNMALETYADYFQKKIVNVHDTPCCSTIDLVQITPLSREEILYAFETLLAWNDIRVVPDGNDFKWEYISQSR